MKRPVNLDALRERYDAIKAGTPTGDLTPAQMRALRYPPERVRLLRLHPKPWKPSTIKQMADFADVTRWTWSAWEKGLSIPSAEHLGELLEIEAMFNADLGHLAYPPEENK